MPVLCFDEVVNMIRGHMSLFSLELLNLASLADTITSGVKAMQKGEINFAS